MLSIMIYFSVLYLDEEPFLKNIPFSHKSIICYRVFKQCFEISTIFVTDPTGHRSVWSDYIYASSCPQVPKPDCPVMASAYEHGSTPVV
jgi:hypothetical protein